MIGNLKCGGTMRRFGKNPNQEKKVISPMMGTQISIMVKCKAAKTVAKSNGRRGSLAIGGRKMRWDRPYSTSELVDLRDGSKLWNGGL